MSRRFLREGRPHPLARPSRCRAVHGERKASVDPFCTSFAGALSGRDSFGRINLALRCLNTGSWGKLRAKFLRHQLAHPAESTGFAVLPSGSGKPCNGFPWQRTIQQSTLGAWPRSRSPRMASRSLFLRLQSKYEILPFAPKSVGWNDQQDSLPLP
jgi:hypothetical protein